MADEIEYYPWQKTFSYDADVTAICTPRGYGKTYGFAKQAVKDYLQHHWRCAELVRYKENISHTSDGYFNKIVANNEFPDYVFKTDNKYMYIAKKPEGDKKPEWEIMGYFAALSKHQDLKRESSRFSRIRRIKLDEAVIDRRKNRYTQYLPHEPEILAEAVDSLSRERPGVPGVKPRVYLLFNAVDLLNPYFLYYGVGTEPKDGYTWYKNKTFLLHYHHDIKYSAEKSSETVAGRMLAAGSAGRDTTYGDFYIPPSDYVAKKPRTATFEFGVILKDSKFGVWFDDIESLYYVNRKIPNGARPVFALTLDDNRTNVIAARRAESALSGFVEMHYCGCIRYDSLETQAGFNDVLRLYGVR